MADRLGARRNGKFKAVSTAPSFNKTPVGSSTPPLPYPVTQDLSNSVATVDSVRLNGDPAYALDQTTQPGCKGDDPGTAKGVKSGTVNGEVKPVKGSSSVNVNRKPLIREGDPCTMNGGNCPGIYVTEPVPSASIAAGAPTASTNPPIEPQTPKEKSFWSKASPAVHGVLGIASFVPGLSVVTGAADAGIYAMEGDFIEAGLAGASMIPGGKIVTTVGKVAKGAATIAKEAGAAAKIAKGAKEAEGAAKAAKLAKEAEEAAKLEKGAKAGGKPPGDGAKVKNEKAGPCDHLRKGNGKGAYRGGAHSKTSKPANDGKDSHHMPSDYASPLKTNEGPAIQMNPYDHYQTSSNGRGGSDARDYRETIGGLLKSGKWRKALLIEINDVREIAKASGDPRKYNEAMLEMLEYFRCLEKNDLLPKG